MIGFVETVGLGLSWVCAGLGEDGGDASVWSLSSDDSSSMMISFSG